MNTELIEAAEQLVPLFKESARETELARQPLDHVIEAVRQSGIFSMMVPKQYGGYEEDMDTFFEVVLKLSRADASMGWITGFYIEHNLWLMNYPKHVVETVLDGADHFLAPGALNIGAGKAEKVDGGYRLNGQWQWGTGIVHGTWVMAGGLVIENDRPVPTFFLMPKSDVEPIDTWHVTGMCGTGSWDFRINDVFVPDDYALPFQLFLDASSGIQERYSGKLYTTPLMPVLALTAGLPILGTAQMAIKEFSRQMGEKLEKKILRAGTPQADVSVMLGEASLTIDTAELVMRDVLADVMEKRVSASNQDRGQWLSQVAYAVHTCKDAVGKIATETGASGGLLSNPIQRAKRDIDIASNHVVFSRQSRYGDIGRALLGQGAGVARV